MSRILFVSNRLYGGGAERVLTILANRFKNEKDEVHILALTSGPKYQIDSGISVSELTEKSRFSSIVGIRKAIKSIKPDVIIAFEYFVNMRVILADIGLKNRLIISERNDPSRKGNGIFKSCVRNLLYSLVDVLVCQTNDARDFFPFFVRRKSVVIPNPLSPGIPLAKKQEKTNEIVAVGRLESQKNYNLLIDAFSEVIKKHEGVVLKIYGEGSLRPYLEQYIQMKNLTGHVFLMGNINDVLIQMSRARLFVMSSDYEGMPNALMEAMAIGLPCISSNCPCGGPASLIMDGINGLLFPVGDTNTLVLKLCYLLENPEIADSLATEATSIRNTHSVDTIFYLWRACCEDSRLEHKVKH